MSVGGARVPTLVSKDAQGDITNTFRTNDEKSTAFHTCSFSPKPDAMDIPAPAPGAHSTERIKTVSRDQIRRNISKLAPYKVPGKDGIPNVVLKRCFDILIDYLDYIFSAIANYNFYYDRWKTIITVIICKPGRATYTLPKSFWPIALYDTIPKLNSACCVEDLGYIAERCNLLPPTHFGG
ncbi:hypothetical protein AURDEDRAFT_64637, partial [Auricularia subglabra TFB-10046 SS5]